MMETGLIAFVGDPTESAPDVKALVGVEFRVGEALEGLDARARTVRVYIGTAAKKGVSYLVFARRVGPRIVEFRGECEPVIPLEDAEETLTYLRRRKTENLAASVSVQLRDADFVAMRGVKLRLVGPGEARTIMTGADGRGEATALASGNWRIEVADSRYKLEPGLQPASLHLLNGACRHKYFTVARKP